MEVLGLCPLDSQGGMPQGVVTFRKLGAGGGVLRGPSDLRKTGGQAGPPGRPWGLWAEEAVNSSPIESRNHRTQSHAGCKGGEGKRRAWPLWADLVPRQETAHLRGCE